MSFVLYTFMNPVDTSVDMHFLLLTAPTQFILFSSFRV